MSGKDKNENNAKSAALVIPPFSCKKKALKIGGKYAVMATYSKKYLGSEAIAMLNKTHLADKRGQDENSQRNVHKPRTGLPTLSSMKNMHKCMDVFTLSLTRSKSMNPVTRKSSYMKAAFITLTIPDAHTLVDSKKGFSLLLKDGIEFLVYHDGITRYVWRFERQDRGQAHWHIVVNGYVDLHRLRTYWIRLLAKHGLSKEYYEKYDFDPEACVQIDGVQNDRDLAFYFNKYFNKKTQSDKPTEGRWWGADLVTKRMQLPRLQITEQGLKRIEVFEEAGVIDVFEPEIKKLRIGSEDKPSHLQQWDYYYPCTIVRALKIGISEILCPLQEVGYKLWIAANRRGDWESARELNDKCLGMDEEISRWKEDHIRMAEDMAFIAQYRPIKGGIEKRLSNRKRRKEVRDRQERTVRNNPAPVLRPIGAAYGSGVSLWPWEDSDRNPLVSVLDETGSPKWPPE